MKYARKTFLVILAMAIMMVVSVSAHAAARWSYLTTIAADLGFDSNGYAFVSVMCDADANDVDKISVKSYNKKVEFSGALTLPPCD